MRALSPTRSVARQHLMLIDNAPQRSSVIDNGEALHSTRDVDGQRAALAASAPQHASVESTSLEHAALESTRERSPQHLSTCSVGRQHRALMARRSSAGGGGLPEKRARERIGPRSGRKSCGRVWDFFSGGENNPRRCASCGVLRTSKLATRPDCRRCSDLLRAAPVVRGCACGRGFINPGSGGKMTCSDECRKARTAEKTRAKRGHADVSKPVPCESCGIEFVRRNGRQKWCVNCAPDKRTTSGKWRRLARAYLLTISDGTCGICGEAMDLAAQWNAESPNDYPTIDHVKMVSEGGSDELSNLRLAHHRCNSARTGRDDGR
jgi:5-methylcytosine-specific restriction endonuclease McrA